MAHAIEIYDYAQAVSEQIAEHLFMGWAISTEMSYQWEQILDGSYCQQEGFPDLEIEIANHASSWRTLSFNILNSGQDLPFYDRDNNALKRVTETHASI